MKVKQNKNKKSKKLIIFSIIFVFVLACVVTVQASALQSKTGLEQTRASIGLPTIGEAGEAGYIGIFIGAAGYLASFIFLILIIYGGFLWMTAGGNEEKVKQGQKFIIWAIIGYIVVALGYIVINFIVGAPGVLTPTQ